MRFTAPWRWIKDEEVVIHLFIHFHYTRFITASVAVVRSRKYCHNLLLMTPIIASHYELMRSSHCFKAIFLYELVRYVLSEGVAGSARRNAPASPIVRIGPKQIAHGSFMRNLYDPVDVSDHV